MRPIWLSAPVFCALSIASCAAQQVHCSLQKPVALTEADTAYLAGDAAHAEVLYSAQLATAKTVANFAGVVKSQLEENKLAEALATAQSAATMFPVSADAESLVGDALRRSGEIPDALLAYKKALALDQCSARAHFGYAKLNELNVAYATAAQHMLFAHKLAPQDAEITAAWIELQPADQRLAAYQALLASKPALTPAELERVNVEAAVLEQHKSCTPVETNGGRASIELLPVLFNGKVARSWGLKTKINGDFTPLLELDTSVSGIVLNASDAQKAGVKPLLAAPAAAGGSYAGYVDHVHLGELDYRDCPVRVVPDSVVANSNSLIGTDFFRNHLIHIDYVALKMTLNPLPDRPGIAATGLSDRFIAPEEKDWSPVYISGPAVLLPTFINKKGPYLFMLDTGNYRSILSPAVASSLLTAQKDATLPLHGMSGPIVKVLRKEGGGEIDRTDVHGSDGRLIQVSTPLKLPVYHFTNNEYPDQGSISLDLSPTSQEVGTEVSGMLGFGVLRGYYLDINYRDGLARVLFDQNRNYVNRQVEGFH